MYTNKFLVESLTPFSHFTRVEKRHCCEKKGGWKWKIVMGYLFEYFRRLLICLNILGDEILGIECTNTMNFQNILF